MDQEILTKAADIVTDKPVYLEVDILPRNRLHGYCQAKGWAAKKKVLTLQAVTLGTLIKISKLLMSVDITHFAGGNLMQSNYKSISEDGRNLALCVAHCIHNKKSEPPDSLINFILQNFTSAELYRTLNLVIKQMDMSSFMTTIISIKGVNILAAPTANAQNAEGMSRPAGETIAPGQPLAG